jgi:hypothetical protein
VSGQLPESRRATGNAGHVLDVLPLSIQRVDRLATWKIIDHVRFSTHTLVVGVEECAPSLLRPDILAIRHRESWPLELVRRPPLALG